MDSRSNDRAEFPLIAIVLIVVVIIVSAACIAIFVPWKQTKVNEARSVPFIGGMKAVSLDLEQTSGRVEVGFTNSSDALVSMTVQGTASQTILSKGDPLNITWSYEAVDDELVVSTKVVVSSYGSFFDAGELVTRITVSKSLVTSLDLRGSTGSISLSAGAGVLLQDVQAIVTTGAVSARLDGCSLSGSLALQTTTGGTTLEWDDVSVSDSTMVAVGSTTGGANLRIQQSDPLSGNVTFSGTTTTGGVRLYLWTGGENSARVTSGTDVGGISVTKKAGFTGSNDDLSSTNYPSDQRLDIDLSTNVGGISLDLEYES